MRLLNGQSGGLENWKVYTFGISRWYTGAVTAIGAGFKICHW